MRVARVVVLVLAAASVPGCGSFADDTGGADPRPSVWPWVCDGGALAPEGGCCPVEAGADGGGEGGC